MVYYCFAPGVELRSLLKNWRLLLVLPSLIMKFLRALRKVMTRIVSGIDALTGERRRYGKDYQWFVHQRMVLETAIGYDLVSKPLSVNTVLLELLITMCITNPAQHGAGIVIIGLVGSPNPTQAEIENSEAIIQFQDFGIRGMWQHMGCTINEAWNLHKTVLGGTKYIVIRLFQQSQNDIGLRVGVRFQEP